MIVPFVVNEREAAVLRDLGLVDGRDMVISPSLCLCEPGSAGDGGICGDCGLLVALDL